MDSVNLPKGNKKQPDKRQAVFELMQIMFNGKEPKEILKKRRPLESKNNHTLEYRLENFYPLHVSLFRRAMMSYIEVLNKSNITISTSSDRTQNFLDTYKKYVNHKNIGLKEWFFNHIAEQKQLDPNAVVLVYPTIEFYDNVPIPKVKSTKSVDLAVDLFDYDDVIILGEDKIEIKVGEIIIDSAELPYYLIIDKQNYFVKYPAKSDEYKTIGLYAHNLGLIPFSIIGGSVFVDDEKEYFVSDYVGAVNIACYLIGVHSDKQVMSSRFSHPIRYEVRRSCTQAGCTKDLDGKHYIFDDKNERIICPTCSGTGYQKDVDMFGSYVLSPPNKLDGENISLQAPFGYVTPPIESLRFAQEEVDNYYNKLAQELCVNIVQNVTNQSAESKSYDIQQKVSLNTYIIESIIRLTTDIFSYIEMLLENRNTHTITVDKPKTWDIKSQNDILQELSDAKEKNAPYNIILELTLELLRKELDGFKMADAIVRILSFKDDLIVYGVNDLATARAALGADITPRQLLINRKGINILKDIISRTDISTYEELEKLFETEISKLLPTTTIVNGL